MKNITAYRLYLALDATTKRLRALGLSDKEIGTVWLDSSGPFRSNMERQIERGEQPSQYRFAEVRVSLQTFYDVAERGNDSYEEWNERTKVLQQEAREAFIRKAVAKRKKAKAHQKRSKR